MEEKRLSSTELPLQGERMDNSVFIFISAHLHCGFYLFNCRQLQRCRCGTDDMQTDARENIKEGYEVVRLLVYLTVKVCLPPNVFIVFSYRRLSDVICADRQKETCLHMDICAYHIARRASAYKRFFYVFVYNHRLHWKGGSCLSTRPLVN